MNVKVFLLLFLIALGGSFFICSKSAFAEDSVQLSKKDTMFILNIVQKKLKTESILSFSDGYFDTKNRAAMIVIQKAIQNREFYFFFREVPKKVAKKVGIGILNLVRIIYNGDTSSIINELESLSVSKANEYLINYLSRNKLKTASGNLDGYIYKSYKGTIQNPSFQFIMDYRRLDNRYGDLAVEFYSSKTIEPPGFTIGTPCDLADNLKPFIIRVHGKINKNFFGGYSWAGDPSISVDFSNNVPYFQFEKPISFFEKIRQRFRNLINRFHTISNEIDNLLSASISDLPKSGYKNNTEKVNELKKKIDKIKIDYAATKKKSEHMSSRISKEDLEKLTAKLEKIKERAKNIKQEVDDMSSSSVSTPKIKIIPHSQNKSAKKNEKRNIKPDKNNNNNKSDNSKHNKNNEYDRLKIKDTSSLSLPKILITEVCAGLDKSKNEFIELYNPNDSDVLLNSNNFHLELVDSNNNVSNKKISWKRNIIPSHRYFLFVGGKIVINSRVVNADAGYSSHLSGVSGIIIADGNDNVLDKVSWGTSKKQPPKLAVETSGLILEHGLQTGKGLFRKSINDDFIDSDNNSSDFSLTDHLSLTNSLGETIQYNKISSQGASFNNDSFVEEHADHSSGNSSNNTANSSSDNSSDKQADRDIFYPVIINEIMYNLKGSDNGREWIELYNNGTSDVDLINWRFTESDTSHGLKSVQGGSIVYPGEYAIIASNAEKFLADNPKYSGILFSSSFSLSNKGETVSIKNGSLEIDSVNYIPDWGANGDGNSLQRISLMGNSNQSDNWKPSPPTPGQQNVFINLNSHNSNTAGDSESLPDESQCPSNNQSPQALFVFYPKDPVAGDVINFDASSSTDPDGNIVQFKWNFGDSDVLEATDKPIVNHSYATSGVFTVTLVVTDNQGSTSSFSAKIGVVEKPEDQETEFVNSIPNHILITEIMEAGKKEYVELYNPTDEDINMCPNKDNCWYFSYFSARRNWNDPWRNKSFAEAPTTTIPAKGYYLIGLNGYPEKNGDPDADWQIYNSSLFSDAAGAIGIFSCNPKIATTTTTTIDQAVAAVENCKIDVLGWGNTGDTIVKEGLSVSSSLIGKVISRRIGITKDGRLTYIDTNNNQNDFEQQMPTPKRENLSCYSDLDNDGFIDSYDPETVISQNIKIPSGNYVFKNLIIRNGAKLILASDYSSSSNLDFRGVKILADTIFISTSSALSADGMGYPANQGPGAGIDGSGGGYGGRGGGKNSDSAHDAIYGYGGFGYGSITQPLSLGSGGGSATFGTGFSSGSAGGGAIWITAKNIIVNGFISANGGNATYPGGSGSGGSIYIVADDLAGGSSASISADGGDSGGSAGSGGRIAIYYTSKDKFKGLIHTYGGDGSHNFDGGAGTVYLKNKNKTSGDLLIDNNSLNGSTNLTVGVSKLSSLNVLNSAHLLFPKSLFVNSIILKNKAVLEALSTTTTSTIKSDLLFVDNRSSLRGHRLIFLKIKTDNIAIKNNSSLIGNFDIDASHLTVDESSFISADGMGYPANQGPGAGIDGSGGGYGGRGGGSKKNGDSAYGIKGSSYGNKDYPNDFGSGGGNTGSAKGGAGGGVININIDKVLVVNGVISSNGKSAHIGDGYAGGGSGGTIYIIANTLTGTSSALIIANGGSSDNCGGGGGRIAYYILKNNFTGLIRADGGYGSRGSSDFNGSPGTVIAGESRK